MVWPWTESNDDSNSACGFFRVHGDVELFESMLRLTQSKLSVND
jgi:hypothetical protein